MLFYAKFKCYDYDFKIFLAKCISNLSDRLGGIYRFFSEKETCPAIIAGNF